MGKDRLGVVAVNKLGSKMKVVEYVNTHDITVLFEAGDMVHASWSDFCKGAIWSVYDRAYLGTGYIGEGPYSAYDKDGNQTAQYKDWYAMLRRCYSKNKNKTSYKNCSVSKDWHNFQNFSKWYEDNYYEVPGEVMSLDKDILHKGNSVYSSDNCIYVPQKLNSLFVRGNKNRRTPIGVSAKGNGFIAKCMVNNKTKYIGYFDTVEAAFSAYKVFKENHIKVVAEEYKDKIPNKLYKAMINYKVEITD